VAPPSELQWHMYFSARTEGRISYGHLGRTSLFDYYDTGIEAVISLRPWNTIDLPWHLTDKQTDTQKQKRNLLDGYNKHQRDASNDSNALQGHILQHYKNVVKSLNKLSKKFGLWKK